MITPAGYSNWASSLNRPVRMRGESLSELEAFADG
jgi:hypothetical protein